MSEQIGYSHVSDRFGFRALGTFRCRRSSETLMLAVVAAVYTLCFCVTIFNMVNVLSRDNSVPIFEYDKTMADYAPTLNILCVITSVIIMLLLAVALIAAVTVILRGEEYSYTANDEKMIITDPKGNKTEFYYTDIKSVRYEKLTLFSQRQRGFDVFIDNGCHIFRYQHIYGRNKLLREERHTPFFILEERAGLRTRRYTDEMGV